MRVKIGAIYPTKLFTDEEAVSEIKKFGSMSDNNFIENVAVSEVLCLWSSQNQEKIQNSSS